MIPKLLQFLIFQISTLCHIIYLPKDLAQKDLIICKDVSFWLSWFINILPIGWKVNLFQGKTTSNATQFCRN